MVTERENWIDSIKGLAIIGTVVGHIILCLYSWGNLFSVLGFLIYSYHMPMFFMVSGYLLKLPKDKSIITVVVEKMINLLVPAIVLGSGAIIIYSLQYINSQGGGKYWNKISIILNG